MRKLLVVSRIDLPEAVADGLSRRNWSVVYSRDPKTTRSIVSKARPLVGLAVFPTERDRAQEARLQQQVAELRRVKWIGTLSEDHLNERDIKHFVATRLHDFHVYPLDPDRLGLVLGHAFGMAQLEHELTQRRSVNTSDHFGIIGESSAMQSLYRVLRRAADSDLSVLITGPTGTGKELAARAIHAHSARRNGPYVAINCAAIPPSLLQSELFGHEKGSFTSAIERKTGYIRNAAGGTLFLDEIGDMPMEAQATLLRFLEDKIVTPIGSTRGQRIDVRVLASTNVDLQRAIHNKTFRADLYYRLALLTLETPALMERGGDIERLAKHFLDEVSAQAGTRTLTLGADALSALHRHTWPGNVRELRGIIFQAALSCESSTIRARDLRIPTSPEGFDEESLMRQPKEPLERQCGAASTRGSTGRARIGTLKSTREQSERRNLERALERNACNVTRTAQDLGISRMTLYRLMAKHGVTRNG